MVRDHPPERLSGVQGRRNNERSDRGFLNGLGWQRGLFFRKNLFGRFVIELDRESGIVSMKLGE